MTTKVGICSFCGAEGKLINHHISYIPELTELVCRKCDGKSRRKIDGRGFIILKGYPGRNQLVAPQQFIEELGPIMEVYCAPISPVGVIFKCGMPLTQVRNGLQLVLQDLEMREEIQMELTKVD